MRRKTRYLLTFILIALLTLGLLSMFYTARATTPISAEDEAIVDRILDYHGDDMHIESISLLKLTKIEMITGEEKVYYFQSYTLFGIPLAKSRVFYRDGQIAEGEVIPFNDEFSEQP